MKRFYAAMIALAACAGLLLPGATSALTFTPPTVDLQAKPGQTVRQTLKLRNESADVVTILASTANFTGKTGDETSGVPEFYPSEEVRDGRGLGPWISFPQSEYALLPGERAELAFTVTVPNDASPGSYFGAVILGSKAGEAAENVSVTGTAAVLVFLRIDGDIVEEMKLAGFSVPGFSSSLPLAFEARVENVGTVHLRPYGEVTVKNAFGQPVAKLAMNRAEYKSVLPGTTRRYTAVWQRQLLKEGASILTRQWQNFAFGPYTAELTLRYGAEERVVNVRTSFWVVPWLVILLFAGGGGLLVWSLRRFFRWYRDWIIRRYEAKK